MKEAQYWLQLYDTQTPIGIRLVHSEDQTCREFSVNTSQSSNHTWSKITKPAHLLTSSCPLDPPQCPNNNCQRCEALEDHGKIHQQECGIQDLVWQGGVYTAQYRPVQRTVHLNNNPDSTVAIKTSKVNGWNWNISYDVSLFSDCTPMRKFYLFVSLCQYWKQNTTFLL